MKSKQELNSDSPESKTQKLFLFFFSSIYIYILESFFLSFLTFETCFSFIVGAAIQFLYFIFLT